MNSNNIDWNDVIKKEARGSGGVHLGEVKDIDNDYVIIEKGVIDKDRLRIPKKFIRHVDGVYVWFKITEEEAKQYKKD